MKILKTKQKTFPDYRRFNTYRINWGKKTDRFQLKPICTRHLLKRKKTQMKIIRPLYKKKIVEIEKMFFSSFFFSFSFYFPILFLFV